VTAACGIAVLAFAAVIERRSPRAARLLSVWGLVSTSLLVWIAVPASSLSPLRIDVVRGVAGMAGWALFAFASAAPALANPPSEPATTSSRALRPRSRVPRGDARILWIGFCMAGLTQAVGWRVVEPERAILVRLLGLAGGLAAVGAAASIIAARHVARKAESPGRRTKRAMVPLIGLGLLLAGGVVVTLARSR
jgi:hypothetical protein